MRKRKNAKPVHPVLVLQSDQDAVYPPAIRYQEHFAYWKSWHGDLLTSLGQIRKRDLQYLTGAINELQSMLDVLSGPPADKLRTILEEMTRMQDKWRESPETWRIPNSDRTRLEQLRREIDKNFYYKKVKEWIPEPKPPATEPPPAGTAPSTAP